MRGNLCCSHMGYVESLDECEISAIWPGESWSSWLGFDWWNRSHLRINLVPAGAFTSELVAYHRGFQRFLSFQLSSCINFRAEFPTAAELAIARIADVVAWQSLFAELSHEDLRNGRDIVGSSVLTLQMRRRMYSCSRRRVTASCHVAKWRGRQSDLTIYTRMKRSGRCVDRHEEKARVLIYTGKRK